MSWLKRTAPNDPSPMGRLMALGVGFFFLYVPIATLIVFSFNSSPIMTSWSGFSWRWYEALLNDQALLSAAWLSFKVATLTATAASIIGTWAGYVLARKGNFKGFSLFVGLVSAPLVIPEVVLGISMLLLFVEMDSIFGWPGERGMFTIWVGHTTFCMAFVTVIVQSRIRDLDRSLEEAALDLGATPLRVFFAVTLPLIAPAIISGWLLAFTLSLDDVVIASFLSGPGATLLSPEIFSRVRLGLKPEVNALATIFVVVVATVVIGLNALQRRQARRGS
ncbi:MAG: ABC transporter permease subunit [Burkholderiaceae bacterium]|nr:ABC transporter permease subunit [Burkholderiaceae bacterium]MCD8538173.1 ABC transporter permease subunit [Burkholderiaceae bacterium]